MATTVTFVRHGRTGFNKEHRYQGWLDLEGCQLLQEGVNQARALGARWKQYDEKYDVVYSSDLGRALMTAQLVSEPIGHEHSSIRIETRLRERNFGRLQGMTGQEIQQTRPNVWTRMKNFDPSCAAPVNSTFCPAAELRSKLYAGWPGTGQSAGWP